MFYTPITGQRDAEVNRRIHFTVKSNTSGKGIKLLYTLSSTVPYDEYCIRFVNNCMGGCYTELFSFIVVYGIIGKLIRYQSALLCNLTTVNMHTSVFVLASQMPYSQPLELPKRKALQGDYAPLMQVSDPHYVLLLGKGVRDQLQGTITTHHF